MISLLMRNPVFFLCPCSTDELYQGRWRKASYRADVFGDNVGPESFSEQQARFAKVSSEVGIVRAEFQCLQGERHICDPAPLYSMALIQIGYSLTAQVILTWWYLSQGR